MYQAGDGIVQKMIGKSALAAQEKIEAMAEKIVGVNCYTEDNERMNNLNRIGQIQVQ